MFVVVYQMYGTHVHVYGSFNTQAAATKWIGYNSELMGRDATRYSVHRIIPARP